MTFPSSPEFGVRQILGRSRTERWNDEDKNRHSSESWNPDKKNAKDQKLCISVV
jgi:hypothetical protein